MKIKGKILSVVLLGVLASSVGIGWATYWFAEKAITAEVTSSLRGEAEMSARNTDSWLRLVGSAVRSWAVDDMFIELAQRQDSARTEVACKEIEEMLGGYKGFEQLFVMDAKGTVIASGFRNIVGKINLGDRGYFKENQAGKMSISPVVLSKTTGNYIFCVSAPMLSGGKFVGAVAVAVDFNTFSRDFVESIHCGKTGYAYMLNAEGLVISHPKKALILKQNANDFEWGREMMASPSGVKFYDWYGVDKVNGFATVDLTGWKLGITTDTSEFLGAVHQLRRICVVLVCFALLLSALLVAPTVSSMVRPLRLLTASANHLALGDVGAVEANRGALDKVKLRRDEIGAIAQSFDRLSGYLGGNAAVAGKIAAGDLGVQVEARSAEDVLGNALVGMVGNLRAMVGDVTAAAASVANNAGQVSDSSQELSQGATEQAASIEEISSSVTEIGAQTANNADNALEAQHVSAAAATAASGGGARMEEMLRSMKEISSSSEMIAKIIKVIDDIAFQTNLLALNAAVEAARAGRHGKGFAVVADEVRNLAGRCAKAAAETTELIEDSRRKVAAGEGIAEQTAKAFEEISRDISKTAGIVDQIARYSKEQSEGVSQISQGLNQIDTVTQRNTASAEETAAAAAELLGEAGRLQQLLSGFSLGDGRGRSESSLDAASADRLRLN